MAQTLEWSAAYSVGHPSLDVEHRDLMLTVARVSEADGEHAQLRPLLCELKRKAEAHFEHESAILREIVAATSSARQSRRLVAAMGQALIEEHLAEHDLALAVLDSMIRKTLSSPSRQMSSIGDNLTHWFITHAVKHDAHLKTLFQTIEHDCPELLGKVD